MMKISQSKRQLKCCFNEYIKLTIYQASLYSIEILSFNICRKISNSWHSFLRCLTMILYMRNSKIQFNHLLSHSKSWYWSYSDLIAYWSLLAMSKSLSASLRFRILRFLLLHWCSKDIVEEIHCHFDIVYRIQKNLFMYDSLFRSQFRLKDASWKIFKIAENDLIVYLEDQSWVMQKEMIWYIWEKWSINVHQFTISRILKRRDWSIKKEQRVEVRQNDELRLNWVADMLRLTTEQLVFMNEFLFNEITDWRYQVYASVDQSARYQVSRTREHCWSVLSIYTKDEYLFCIDIRKNWFNDETFFQWLADELLSLCSLFSTSRSVIIMNNASVHCNSRIEELIISHECQISYLPRWIDDLSLIWMSGAIFASLLVELQSHRTHLQRIKDLSS